MAWKQHTPEEKSKLVLEALRGERTINEIHVKRPVDICGRVELLCGECLY